MNGNALGHPRRDRRRCIVRTDVVPAQQCPTEEVTPLIEAQLVQGIVLGVIRKRNGKECPSADRQRDAHCAEELATVTA